MSRNIKQVTHDLDPSIVSINDISQELTRALAELFEKVAPVDPKIKQLFLDSRGAVEALVGFAEYAFDYIKGLDAEADREGIIKPY